MFQDVGEAMAAVVKTVTEEDLDIQEVELEQTENGYTWVTEVDRGDFTQEVSGEVTA